MNIFEPRYQNEDAAREHLESLHWPDGPFCPHCGSFNAKRLPPQKGRKTKAHPEGAIRKGVVQCNDCRQQYTVTVGTIFESSKVGLHKWLYVNHVLCSSKKGTSAHQIARNIGVSYKTAWFMMHRIREAMKETGTGPMGGPGKTVEADETYVGGKAKNRATRKPAPKKIVMALVERDGRARSFHIADVNAATLRTALVTNVDRASGLMTDNLKAYALLGREFASHGIVSHSTGEYAKGKKHSNTAENFFSIFKRGIIGVYHHVSEAHLHRYCAEFDFRYNTRKLDDAERADENLLGAVGKRLTYRRAPSLAA
jgi:transposase-like protein